MMFYQSFDSDEYPSSQTPNQTLPNTHSNARNRCVPRRIVLIFSVASLLVVACFVVTFVILTNIRSTRLRNNPEQSIYNTPSSDFDNTSNSTGTTKHSSNRPVTAVLIPRTFSPTSRSTGTSWRSYPPSKTPLSVSITSPTSRPSLPFRLPTQSPIQSKRPTTSKKPSPPPSSIVLRTKSPTKNPIRTTTNPTRIQIRTESPTKKPILTRTPTWIPTISPTTEPTFPDLHFYVMGDIPYSRTEEGILAHQLTHINDSIQAGSDLSLFMVHLGDMMQSNFSKCAEEKYKRVLDILHTSSIPVLTTPGDNDWTQCPNPDLAWANYTKYFIGSEMYWNRTNLIPSLIQHSPKRRENWSLWYRHVFFLAIDMVFTEEQSWETRIQDDIDWFHENCDKYCGQARAIIILGHSIMKATSVFEAVNARVYHLGIPVIYFTGNGHSFLIKRGVGEGDLPGDYFWRIQVDEGAKAPPLKVSIRGNNVDALSRPFQALNVNQTVFRNMIMVDRGLGVDR